MTDAVFDPYAVLGVPPEVSDLELRRVYRALVKRHHPDHNGGSAESAQRFAQIQNAYAAVAALRRQGAAAPTPPAAAADPGVEARMADLERELALQREVERRRMQERARLAREQADRVAAADQPRRRPTPEELGYYSTDDSFTKIIDDAAEQLGQTLNGSDAKQQFAQRLSDLFGHRS